MELEAENVDCSIDRLTMLASGANISSNHVYLKLRSFLSEKIANDNILELIEYEDGFAIEAYKFYEFGGYGKFDVEENVMFVNCVKYNKNKQDCLRIDFNPNTLKKRDVEYIWGWVDFVLTMFKMERRLSRFDLAFDIYEFPEIAGIKNIRGGITKKQFFGRSGDLESIYWGSRASNVQIRLYDKRAEIGTDFYEYEHLRLCTYCWRLELQLRTKVINEEMIDEVLDRLSDFVFYEHCNGDDLQGFMLKLKPEMRLFADVFLTQPQNLKLYYPDMPERTMKYKKSQVRKALREENTSEEWLEAIKKALRRDTEKLNKELERYYKKFLSF